MTAYASKASERREAAMAAVLFLTAVWLWTMAVGRDISWDVVNHHLYLPFSLLTGRYATDLFAAGPQSYQNPLGYLPFYLLASGSLPSWLVGTLAALAQGLVVLPLWSLLIRIFPGEEQRTWRALALTSALVTPVFLITVGTSSIDPWSSILAIWALSLVLGIGSWRSLLAGALLGLAFAIKPSSAVFLLATGIVLCLRVATGALPLKSIPAFGAATVLVAVVAMGPWSRWLYATFGNPLFPMFNHWFESPYAPVAPMAASRFAVHGATEFLTRLVDLAAFRPFTYTEAFTPDLRPLALALLGLPAAWRLSRNASASANLRTLADRPTALVTIYLLAGYVLWLATSGNGRYAIPLFLLAPVALVIVARAALPRRWAVSTIVAVSALQAAYYLNDGEHRFFARPWDSRPFLDVTIPERLAREPYLHLSVGTLSFAGLAPYLHPAGAMINVSGQMSLPMSGPLGAAVRVRLDRFEGRTRMLFWIKEEWSTRRQSEGFRDAMDRVVYRFGLRADWNDCEVMRVRRDAAGPEAGAAATTGVPVVSCGLVPLAGRDAAYEAELALADSVFRIVESQCPKPLSPAPLVTEPFGKAWLRHYINTEAKLLVSRQDGVTLTRYRSPEMIRLGSIDEVLAGKGLHPCEAWTALVTP